MKFKIYARWEMSAIVEVEADSLYEAIAAVEDDPELPTNGEYIDSSFEVDTEITSSLNR